MSWYRQYDKVKRGGRGGRGEEGKVEYTNKGKKRAWLEEEGRL